MFGVDRLVLSKPKDVRTVASKTFTENIKNAVDKARSKTNTVDFYEKELITEFNKPEEPKKKLEKPSILNKIEQEKLEINKENIESIRKAVPKVTIIKPVAKGFLNQVNKIEDTTTKNKKERLIFSYSDSKGRYGNLENNGSRLKLLLNKVKAKDYIEEQISIYSLQEQLVKQNGLFVQVKGWGNAKELAIANALKKSVEKFAIASNEAIIYNYTVSSINTIADGGWECKVKVTPGKV